MLFGSKEQRELVLKTAEGYADSAGMKLAFGAMVSSVSKNTHYPDSDYDAVFLYLREDFPERTYELSGRTEHELIRKYRQEDEVFDCIPFWEMTSFLHLLVRPVVKFDSAWYHVNWVFMSPYTWDPYGLQNQILPLMNRIFEGRYEIAYRKWELNEQRKYLNDGYSGAKRYLRAVHAAATIEWCLQYPECPPMDLQALLYGLGRECVWEETGRILDQARAGARKYAEPAFARGVSKRDFHRPAIVTTYNPLLVEYVDEVVRMAGDAEIPERKTPEERGAVVECMYKMIRRGVFENEALLYRGSGGAAPGS